MDPNVLFMVEDMKNKANALRDYASNIQNSIKHILETVNTFNTAWTGADASAYVVKLTAHVEAMNIKIASINNFADHLDLAAANFGAAAQQNVDAAAAISTPIV